MLEVKHSIELMNDLDALASKIIKGIVLDNSEADYHQVCDLYITKVAEVLKQDAMSKSTVVTADYLTFHGLMRIAFSEMIRQEVHSNVK